MTDAQIAIMAQNFVKSNQLNNREANFAKACFEAGAKQVRDMMIKKSSDPLVDYVTGSKPVTKKVEFVITPLHK